VAAGRLRIRDGSGTAVDFGRCAGLMFSFLFCEPVRWQKILCDLVGG
jgi:hypothetical protein